MMLSDLKSQKVNQFVGCCFGGEQLYWNRSPSNFHVVPQSPTSNEILALYPM
jgi:hypothetical protein